MSSLIAGYTTLRFNVNFAKLVTEYYNDIIHDMTDDYCRLLRTKKGDAYFDCRVYGVDDNDEVFNSFMWRCRDAEKNSRSMFAQTYCSHKQLLGLTGEEQVEFCKNKTGKDWNEVDDKYKYGVFVKKELYEVPDRNPNGDDNEGFVTRSRICVFTNKLTSYSEEGVEMIIGQHK